PVTTHSDSGRAAGLALIPRGRAGATCPLSAERPSGSVPRMTESVALTDAEAEYLARIWEDCEGCLGPGAELLDVRPAPAEEGVRLGARYRRPPRAHDARGV